MAVDIFVGTVRLVTAPRCVVFVLFFWNMLLLVCVYLLAVRPAPFYNHIRSQMKYRPEIDLRHIYALGYVRLRYDG